MVLSFLCCVSALQDKLNNYGRNLRTGGFVGCDSKQHSGNYFDL
jgi:hypothetical protein